MRTSHLLLFELIIRQFCLETSLITGAAGAQTDLQ